MSVPCSARAFGVALGARCGAVCASARGRRAGGATDVGCDIDLGALGANKATTSVGQHGERHGTNRNGARHNIDGTR